jgi:hypothetical protein
LAWRTRNDAFPYQSARLCGFGPFIALPARRRRGWGDHVQQLRKHGPWTNALYDPRNAYRSDTAAALRHFHVLALHLQEGDWDGAALDAELVAYLAAHPGIDGGRLFLTGVSRGGRGVLRLAIQRLWARRLVTAVASFCPAGGAAEYSDVGLVLLRQVPIYCARDRLVAERTALVNQLRAFLLECGIVLPQRRRALLTWIDTSAADGKPDPLSSRLRLLVTDMRSEWAELDCRIGSMRSSRSVPCGRGPSNATPPSRASQSSGTSTIAAMPDPMLYVESGIHHNARSVAFSSDGPLIAAGSIDRNVKVK